MPIPDKIPIQRVRDDHTHFVGMTSDGRQFFGYETYVFPNGVPSLDWKKHRREYVVLYLFDKKGNHLETLHWFAGMASETSETLLRNKLRQFVSELGKTEFKDISIKPFQTKIDGFVFGLVINPEEESVELEPSTTISFQEPWEGEFCG
jgi:hypothetical protein